MELLGIYKNAVIDTGRWGQVRVFDVCPENIAMPVNVILYIHGAGWVFGSFHTHEKPVREPAARTCSVVFFYYVVLESVYR